MNNPRLIEKALQLYSHLLSSPMPNTNLAVERGLNILLQAHADLLPELTLGDKSQSEFLNQFRLNRVSNDKGVDMAMLCLLVSSELFWEATELVCTHNISTEQSVTRAASFNGMTIGVRPHKWLH